MLAVINDGVELVTDLLGGLEELLDALLLGCRSGECSFLGDELALGGEGVEFLEDGDETGVDVADEDRAVGLVAHHWVVLPHFHQLPGMVADRAGGMEMGARLASQLQYPRRLVFHRSSKLTIELLHQFVNTLLQ